MIRTTRYTVYGVAIGLIVMGFGLSKLFSNDTIRLVTPSGEAVNSVGFKELTKTLRELKVTWNPRGKARILERARHWGPVFEAPLTWILARPRHELMAQAILVAGELGLHRTRDRIVQLAGSGPSSARALAIVAAERLERWSREELSEFLVDDHRDVQIAALEVVAGRRGRLFPAVVTALGSDDYRVQKAALKAVPSVMVPEDLEIVLEMAELAIGEEVLPVLRVFEATRITDDVDEFLTAKLDGSNPLVIKAVLGALAGKRSRLRNPMAVWELVVDRDVPLDVRVRAFHCLEKTRSYDLKKLRAEMSFTDPVLTYFSARCLIDGGDREGAGRLIELLNERADGVLDEGEAEVLAATRKLLGQLSGTSPGAGIGAWSQWYWYGGALRTRSLPEPPSTW